MIISEVKLNPFGGLNKKDVQLRKGLNVILGPNEAGKSTIFYAIQKALFIPVNLTKREFEREIARYLPIGGGDTIKVELVLQANSDSYILKRSWGATKNAELNLPDGTLMTEESQITLKLESLLHAKEGTVKSVLMSYQTGLSKTLEELKNNYPETLQSFGDVLRKSILETDGVSVERFKDRINTIYDDYFKHWDRDKNYPEKGKGIENPYKKDIGSILYAYYEKEKLNAALQRARIFEDNMDQFNQQILESTQHITTLEQYINKYKKTVQDARDRRVLESQIEAKSSKIIIIKKVSRDWPVLENKISDINKKLPELEQKEKAVTDEKKEADQIAKNKDLRDRYKRLQQKKEKIGIANKELKKVKKITREELETIQETNRKVGTLKTSLSSSKLAANFVAQKDYVLLVQKDFDKEFQQKIEKGQPFNLQAGGRIIFKHSDWSMEISSGEGNVEEIIQNLKNAEDELNTLFTQYDIENLEIAKQINQAYEEKERVAKALEQQFEDELGDDDFDELKLKISELGEEKTTRLVEDIVKDLVNNQNEIKQLKENLSDYENNIEEFKDEYESQDKLILQLAEMVREEKELKEKVKSLAPLPEEAGDVESFIKAYENKQAEFEQQKQNKQNLLLDRANLEKDTPEFSVEEIENQYKEANEMFDQVLRKGEAVARIRDLTLNLLEKLDSQTYEGIEKDLGEFTALLTNDKYSRIKMDESLPNGYIREDGNVLTYDLLSTGTKDVLALALRLSMAKYFLKDADGFLIMDDPLVDLDPERQKRAAEVISSFAEEKQILIFTCHPLHAEVLGGYLINI